MGPDADQLARARLLLAADHDREAEDLSRLVLGRSPDSAPGLEILARALTSQGRGKEGAEAARAGLAVDPDDLGLGLALCNALIRAKQSHEARGIATALVTAHPHSAEAHYTLALAYLGAPEPHLGYALRAAQEAWRLAPYDPQVLNLCGVCHNAVGEREQARRAFHAALEQDPSNSFALSNLAGQDIGSFRLKRGSTRLSAAMLASPDSRLLQRQFARQLTRIGFRFFALALVSLFAVFLLNFQAWWIHAGVAALIVAVMVGLAVPVVRSLPRGMRNWAPLVWRHASGTARISLVVGAGMVAWMLWFGFGPSTAPPSPASASSAGSQGSGSVLDEILSPGLLVTVGLARVGWSRRRRRRRLDRSHVPPL
jgi:Flp pilus assembly protein TadD